MEDFYNDGFEDGYGRNRIDNHEYPQTDSDRDSYKRGFRYGELRRRIREELEREEYR